MNGHVTTHSESLRDQVVKPLSGRGRKLPCPPSDDTLIPLSMPSIGKEKVAWQR